MNRLLVPALSVCLLSGCAGIPLPSLDTLPEADFLKLVQENIPGIANATEETLRSLGESTCSILRDGGEEGLATSIRILTDGGMSDFDAGQFLGFAVSTYCPELTEKLPTQAK